MDTEDHTGVIARARRSRTDQRIPKKIFRAMRLGAYGHEIDPHGKNVMRIVAGVAHRWWVPDGLGPNVPEIVIAHVWPHGMERSGLSFKGRAPRGTPPKQES
jgi:hypothetical protein